MLTWPYATPESQGIESDAILKTLRNIEETKHPVQALMIVRHGKCVYEGYWAPYGPDIKRALYSCTKAFASTAIGYAVSEGKLSVNDRILDLFPEYTDIQNMSENKKKMTVRNLLTMRTGHTEDTTMALMQSDDWVRTFLDLPVDHEPGAPFVYNSGASHILSIIAERALGKPTNEIIKERLFDPLGITDFRWDMYAGHAMGGWGLWLRPEDFMKVGMCYLQMGRWNGQQVIPEMWVRECSKKQVESINVGPQEYMGDADWSVGYTYQFWKCRYGAYRFDGAAGQQVNIMNNEDMCVMYNCKINDLQYVQDFMNDILFPGIHPNALPENPEAFRALMDMRRELLQPSAKPYSLPECAKDVLGAEYTVQGAPSGITKIRIEEIGGALQIDFGCARILAGLDGVWRVNPWPLIWQDKYQEFSACGALADWTEQMLRIEFDPIGPLGRFGVKLMAQGNEIRMEGMLEAGKIFEDVPEQKTVVGRK